MRQAAYILYDETNEYVVDLMCSKLPDIDKKVYSKNLEITEDLLLELCRINRDFFYVIKTNEEIEFSKKLSFVPPDWDRSYVHFWNHDTVLRLYCKEEVLKNIGLYTDKSMHSGTMPMKDVIDTVYRYVDFDIAFLSYDEVYSDKNFESLKSRFPRAFRIDRVKGIIEAHKAAAEKSTTDMFYVVDADADILPTFNFDYRPHSVDRHSVHVWHSLNPVNGLEYGYGGIKLFPTSILRNFTGSPIDFTTSVSDRFKIIKDVASVTKFNTDPFSTWRSSFRECSKLASSIIKNGNNEETEYRLSVWCTVGDGEFGDFSIMGANEGREFGTQFANQPDTLRLINDFEWLEKRFSQT